MSRLRWQITWRRSGQGMAIPTAHWSHLGSFENMPLPAHYPQRDSALLCLARGLDFVGFKVLVVISNVQPGLRNTELREICYLVFHNCTDGWTTSSGSSVLLKSAGISSEYEMCYSRPQYPMSLLPPLGTGHFVGGQSSKHWHWCGQRGWTIRNYRSSPAACVQITNTKPSLLLNCFI